MSLAPTITLGAQLPHLQVLIAARSTQGFALVLTDETDGTPIVLEGSVALEVDGGGSDAGKVWNGTTSGNRVDWNLSPEDTDLPAGRRPVRLVRTNGNIRSVMAPGVVIVE